MTFVELKRNKGIWIPALCVFTAHYHSGQWSRGYRLCCDAQKAWERLTGNDLFFDYWEKESAKPESPIGQIYAHLVTEYENGI